MSKRRALIPALILLLGAVGYAVAAYPPQDPAASLDAWLRDVWAQGVDKAYMLYMGKSAVAMDPEARQAFPRQMLELAASPNVAGILLQKDKSRFYPKDHLPDAEEFKGAAFVHFVRAGSQSDSIAERIYINVHPDHGAEVMGFIVRELLGRPGIASTKLADPSGLQHRADSILIYAVSLADVDWCLGRLSEYQATHHDHFLPDLPAATRPRKGLTGVGTAAQPARNSDSFGSYLSRTAQAAMHQPPPSDFAEFRARVRALMTADGVDPDRPDRLSRRPRAHLAT